MSRREFLSLASSSAFSLALSGCDARNLPVEKGECEQAGGPALPFLQLASSAPYETSYPARIEGSLPPDLRGTLYRNGPGLFERGGLRKQCILDGDGMIQAFHFSQGQVHFKNRFVRTRKFQAESKAGEFLYATWSTQAPGGRLANLFRRSFQNQAGVTVVAREGGLYAFDEFHPPYQIDPDSLETLGETWLGLAPYATVFSAHSKIDPANGDWIFSGLEMNFTATLHLTVFSRNGALKKHQSYQLPTLPYLHDFFISENYIIVNVHPAEIELYPFLSGQKSMAGSLKWRPQQGNTVLVFARHMDSEPVQLQVDAAWMWHSLNAYEENGEIIADFVGYANPDHFIGKNPMVFAMMKGCPGDFKYPGELRRYVINPASGKIRQELLATGSHEFPYVNPQMLSRKHRYGYFAVGSREGDLYTAVARVDMQTGKAARYDFGAGVYCSEPLFVAKPGVGYLPASAQEPGWLLTEVLDSHNRVTFLALFEADDLAAGPIAAVYLREVMPQGFHGFWKPA